METRCIYMGFTLIYDLKLQFILSIFLCIPLIVLFYITLFFLLYSIQFNNNNNNNNIVLDRVLVHILDLIWCVM